MIVTIVTVVIIALDFYETLTGGVPLTREGIMIKMFVGIVWMQIGYASSQIIRAILPKEVEASDTTKGTIYHMVTCTHIAIIAYLAMVIATFPLFKGWGMAVAIVGTIILVELSSKVLAKLIGLFIRKELTPERTRMINNWMTIVWDACCIGAMLYLVTYVF